MKTFLTRTLALVITIGWLLFTPSSGLAQAPPKPDMKKLAQLTSLDLKIRQLNADIAGLPMPDPKVTAEMTSLNAEADQIPKRKETLWNDSHAKQMRLDSAKKAIASMQQEIDALNQQLKAVYAERAPLERERLQKFGRVFLAEHPSAGKEWWETLSVDEIRREKVSVTTPATPQELPGLKRDITRLNGLTTQLNNRMGPIQEKTKARTQAMQAAKASPAIPTLERESAQLMRDMIQLGAREKEIGARRGVLATSIMAAQRAATTRTAKADTLRRVEGERKNLARQLNVP